ncbi:MAG: MFS transporter [Nitrososphaerales archaeon]
MSRVLLLVYIQACIIGVAYGAHAPLLPVFAKQELAASYADIGLIGMANYVPYMFMPALVGMLLDRFNKGSILSIGITISMFSVYMLSLSASVLDVMLIRALSGIAHAFFWPSAVAIVTDAVGQEQRVQVISRFTMAWVGGYMVGPLVGAFLFEQFGFRELFQYSAFIMVASLMISLSLIRHVRVGYAEGYSVSTVFTIIKANPKLSTLVMYYSASFGIVLTIFPAYLKDNMINEFAIGILFFIFGLSRLFTLPFTQKFAKNERFSIFVATESIAFAMLAAYAITTIGSFSLSLIMFGFAFSLYFPLTLSAVTKDTRRNLVGTTIGAYETIFGIGWAAGSVVAGVVSDTFGNDIPYISMFAIGIALPLLVLAYKR